MSIVSVYVFLGIVLAATSVRFHSLGQDKEGLLDDYEMVETASKRIVKLTDGKFLEVLQLQGNSLYQYSSGHYCMDVVLTYYANAYSLSLNYPNQLFDEVDFDQLNFTSPERLVKAVQRVLNSEDMRQHSRVFGILMQQNLDSAILERCIELEMPVVMLVNAEHSRNGHYVIAIGYDHQNYYFFDPQQQESIGFVAKEGLSQLGQVRSIAQDRWASNVGLIITYKHHRAASNPRIRPSPTKQ